MERRALLQTVAVFAGALVVGAAVEAHLERLDVEARRRGASEIAHASSHAIEQEFARALVATSALAAMVSEGASERELAGVANRLLQLDGGILNLQLARDHVISHLWPRAGNEPALGLDLLRSESHGPYTRRVIETRAPIIYGPFELVQGGVGIAVRVPVRDPVDPERLWGLSSAILRVKHIEAASRLDALATAGFDWELNRETGGAREHVAGEGERRPVDPVTVPVVLTGERWSLDLAPRGGWRPTARPTGRQVMVGLVALLVAIIAYRFLSLPALLRREVAARTAELEIAHREQRRAEEAQRQSQKLEAIGLLAGGVAHDFNNLLVGILGYADVVAEDAPPGSVQAEAARTITQAAQRAAALTRQLLAVARLGRHREEPVDLHALVREVCALLERTLEKAIRVDVRLEAPAHVVRGDPGQLQQVILNLAVNARDAMPDGGTLGISTSVDGPDGARRVTLTVADTGVGMPKEHLDRIFEPFFTTKGEGRGTGLGLATAYGIVKAHGGKIEVRSDLGRGSRFAVSLPAWEGAPEERKPAPAALPRGRGVVLVVDDEEVVRRTAGRMLASLGFEPVLVAGGREALEWLERSAPPAAILLDLAMPGMDGAACFRAVRARDARLRVVLSSGFTRDVRVEELISEGAIAFVEKPYGTAELARALALATQAAA